MSGRCSAADGGGGGEGGGAHAHRAAPRPAPGAFEAGSAWWLLDGRVRAGSAGAAGGRRGPFLCRRFCGIEVIGKCRPLPRTYFVFSARFRRAGIAPGAASAGSGDPGASFRCHQLVTRKLSKC